MISIDCPDQQRCDVQGSLVKVFLLKCAGLSHSTDNFLLYVREDVVTFWEKLEAQHKIFFIDGPPGIGKSTAAWAWACYAGRTKPICWIHVTLKETMRWVDFKGDGKIDTLASSKATDVASVISRTKCSILIVDGVTQGSKSVLGVASSWQEQEQNRRVVFVSSEQVRYASFRQSLII